MGCFELFYFTWPCEDGKNQKAMLQYYLNETFWLKTEVGFFPTISFYRKFSIPQIHSYFYPLILGYNYWTHAMNNLHFAP